MEPQATVRHAAPAVLTSNLPIVEDFYSSNVTPMEGDTEQFHDVMVFNKPRKTVHIASKLAVGVKSAFTRTGTLIKLCIMFIDLYNNLSWSRLNAEMG